MQLFVFGHGYSAEASVRHIRQDVDAGATIAGTTRVLEREDEAESSLRLHAFDGTSPGETLRHDLRGATHLLVSIPPDAAGDPALRLHHADLGAARHLKWIGYFSTVGVYGDFGGAWVDETAPTRPTSPRSQWRVEAEQQWRDYAEARGLPLLILRLAGIYGPGRSAFDRLRDGTARRIVKPGQVFNRIHVEDIGRVTALAAARRLGGTFNLSDGEPAPPQDMVEHAAKLLSVPVPPDLDFATAELTEMARSFYGDNKRVKSRAILDALRIELLYPSYREGLAGILKAGG